MAEPNCHYCEDAAVHECSTCGRLYCDEHGDDVCLRCMAPEAAAPGRYAFRGSLVALAIGSLVALYLIVRPPESASEADPLSALGSPTPSFRTTATPTPRANGSPTPAGTPGANTSPSPGAQTHTVVEGDTLSGIAQQYGVSVEALQAANPGTAETLLIGSVLTIPPAQ